MTAYRTIVVCFFSIISLWQTTVFAREPAQAASRYCECQSGYYEKLAQAVEAFGDGDFQLMMQLNEEAGFLQQQAQDCLLQQEKNLLVDNPLQARMVRDLVRQKCPRPQLHDMPVMGGLGVQESDPLMEMFIRQGLVPPKPE